MEKTTFSTTIEAFEDDLWGYHVVVPSEVATAFNDANHKRVKCSINGNPSFHCAIMPHGNEYFFVYANKKLRTALGLVKGQAITVSLEPDNSEYGMEMPEELREVMNQDPEGDRLFHALTPGKQRNLIHIVSTVKSPDIRIRKSFVIMEHLRSQKGKIDFKVMNEEMKAANQAAKRGL